VILFVRSNSAERRAAAVITAERLFAILFGYQKRRAWFRDRFLPSPISFSPLIRYPPARFVL
jgi:hypothetical protein